MIACATAKPAIPFGPAAAYVVPAAVPAPVVTATSTQVVARNYNGIAAAPLVAPVAHVAKVSTLEPAFSAAYVNAAPLTYAGAPLAYAAPFSHALHASPAAYSSHLIL